MLQTRLLRNRFRSALWALALVCSTTAWSGQIDIAGPGGSQSFGRSVAVLPNGNIVVTDPDWSSRAGAVHLYSPAGILLNTVAGNLANDAVGSGGIVVLQNGNYVIPSSAWHGVGAVTWGSATAGVAGGVVSAANSLVGTSPADGVGSRVIALSNGHYVVGSPFWDALNLGAATWGNGNGGTVGAVSASNSLIGVANNSRLGDRLTALSNGNYVVASNYVSSQGSVTWGNGNGGTVGSVSPSNSLVGSVLNDFVGSTVIALGNGHYVASSPSWDNGAAIDAGAVTWGNGNGGTVGAVSAANSLVGTTSNDRVGAAVAALGNGNCVVRSPSWDGVAQDVGAATWCNGNGGTVGAVSAGNSLVGTAMGDQVGSDGVTALSNGHYVVRSSFYWNNGAATDAGAVTWGNGNGGTTGAVGPGNSLVGMAASDRVGVAGVAALSNGNYVVASPEWRNGAAAVAGAATWGNGNGGTVGAVSAGNSLVGTLPNDAVGRSVTALSNGHYVVGSDYWSNAGASLAGAATWGDGNGGTVGPVSVGNSLVGATNDQVGFGVTPLADGNYVVDSPSWSGPAAQVGAATWGNGSGGTVGPVSTANSLTGSLAFDYVAKRATTPLMSGDYVVSSPEWDHASITQAGAITLRRSWERSGASIVAENSVRGLVAGGGNSLVWGYDPVRDQLAVGRPMENILTLFKSDARDLPFRDGFD